MIGKRTWTIIILILIALALSFLLGTGSDSRIQNKENDLLGEGVVADVATSFVSYFEDVEGYLAMPEDEGVYPGLILIHEWWGLNDNIRDLAEEFASQGYVALAVDLYSGQAAETSEQAGVLAGAVREDVAGAFANLSSAVAYLEGLENVDSNSLASVGWCFGGGWAYEMAANDLGIDASVMYYGRFSLEDDLSMMRTDILGHFGEEDRSIAVDDVEAFEAKLNTLEGDHAVFIYPNAGHAFANEDNEDAYNEEAARQAWERTMSFLARELKE
jgi:carboxymethylenebutenolidase